MISKKRVESSVLTCSYDKDLNWETIGIRESLRLAPELKRISQLFGSSTFQLLRSEEVGEVIAGIRLTADSNFDRFTWESVVFISYNIFDKLEVHS